MKEKTKKALKIGAIATGILTGVGICFVIGKNKEKVGKFFETDLSQDEADYNARQDIVKNTMNNIRKDLEQGYNVAYHFDDGKYIDMKLTDDKPDWVTDNAEFHVYF